MRNRHILAGAGYFPTTAEHNRGGAVWIDFTVSIGGGNQGKTMPGAWREMLV